MGLHHVITSCFILFIYFSGFWLHHMTLVWTFINMQFRGEVIIIIKNIYIYIFFFTKLPSLPAIMSYVLNIFLY